MCKKECEEKVLTKAMHVLDDSTNFGGNRLASMLFKMAKKVTE